MSAGIAAQRVMIVNTKGLHARASAAFARLSMAYESQIEVRRDGETADGRSIMDLLMLGAHLGSEINISANGPDAEQAVTALAALVAEGFGEDDPPMGS